MNIEFCDLLGMHRSEASEAQDKFSTVSSHTPLLLGNMLTPYSSELALNNFINGNLFRVICYVGGDHKLLYSAV